MKCFSNLCPQEGVVRFFEIHDRALLGEEKKFCESHANDFWNSYISEKRIGIGRDSKLEDAACFELELIMADEKNHIQMISLREVGKTRGLSFPIDFFAGLYRYLCPRRFILQGSSVACCHE